MEAKSRLENIDEFLSVTQEFEKRNEDKTLLAFLTELALIADIDTMDDDADGAVGCGRLMTMHSAKGLEFPVVFIDRHGGRRVPRIPRTLEDEEEMEEERRLAYVGITRAEKQLYLTLAQSRTLFGRTRNEHSFAFLAGSARGAEGDGHPRRRRSFRRSVPAMAHLAMVLTEVGGSEAQAGRGSAIQGSLVRDTAVLAMVILVTADRRHPDLGSKGRHLRGRPLLQQGRGRPTLSKATKFRIVNGEPVRSSPSKEKATTPS